jgi:hypothetical protein
MVVPLQQLYPQRYSMFNTHKNRNLVYIIYFALSAEIHVHAVVILWKGSKAAIIL